MSRLSKFLVTTLITFVFFASIVGIVWYLTYDSKEDWLATDVKQVNPHYLTSSRARKFLIRSVYLFRLQDFPNKDKK